MSKRTNRFRVGPMNQYVPAPGPIPPGSTDVGSKRFRVHITARTTMRFVIFADSPDDAVAKVKAGFGEHAGSTTPEVVSVEVGEYSDASLKASEASEKSLIEVVS